MPNRWTEFVKKWAKDHDTTYGCALSQPACKNEYRAKYGYRKNLPKSKEKELMGMEDVDAKPKGKKKHPIPKGEKLEEAMPTQAKPPIQLKIKEKPRKKPAPEAKERMAMASEDISSRLKRDKDKEMEERYSMGAEEFHTKKYLKDLEKEKSNRLRELSRMMGEDYRPLEEAMPSESQVKTPIDFKKFYKRRGFTAPEPAPAPEPAKKQRGRPKKYSTPEEAQKAKREKTMESNKKMAEMRKRLLEEARAKLLQDKMEAKKAIEDAKKPFSPLSINSEVLEEALPTEAQVKKPINVKVSSLSKRVQSLPRDLKREVLSYIREPDYFLGKIDKKELKRLILEWLDKYTKIRGKIDPKKKVWLNQEPIKIIQDYQEMYRRHQQGIPLGDFPNFKFTGTEFTPSNLLKYIKDKTSSDVDVDYKVGDIFLINYKKDLVRIEKITPTTVTIKFDNKISDEYSRGSYNETIERGRFAQDFKGKSQTIKHSIFRSKDPEPVPSNFNYRWRDIGSIPD